MSKAKIGLSQKETELLMDATFILTKNAILEKVIPFTGVTGKATKFSPSPPTFYC